MWWHDIKEIKNWLFRLEKKVDATQERVSKFFDEEENRYTDEDLFNKLNEMIDTLEHVEKEMPKFMALVNPDDVVGTYNKHIKKVEEMLLEFKGCVSMSRAALAENKELADEFKELKECAKICKELYKSMLKFIEIGHTVSNQHFKIDAIYKAVAEKEEQKPKKKKSAGRPKRKVPSLSIESIV